MQSTHLSAKIVGKDLVSGLVVFLVALPLCLGVALASGADLFSGLLAGIVGGLIVGALSGSHTSVSGPAAGLTAVVAAEVASLGSYEAFLVAVIMAGGIQFGLGVARLGFFANYFPTSVIKGLLAAIGIILILKQIPHLFGDDADFEGDFAFWQNDQENTFSELIVMMSRLEQGAITIGLISLAILIIWNRIGWLKKTGVPAPLIVVLFGVAAALFFRSIGGDWFIERTHMVNVPIASSLGEFRSFLNFPDFTILATSKVYFSAVTVAIVASLETLLNLEAVDRIDPKQRASPPNRELIAQGIGNMASGFIGGLPVTSVIVRSSVNIQTGNHTKISTIFHGLLLLLCVAFIPGYLNLIPLSCLAAILIVTGYKLANLKLVREMWNRGYNQFLPFALTVIAIVLTDLLIGIVIGLVVAVFFILYDNLSLPIKILKESHVGGQVLRIKLGDQVSFLNKAVLQQTLDKLESGQRVLIDAGSTMHIDSDVREMLKDFDQITGPARSIEVSLVGFGEESEFKDRIQFIDTPNRELQSRLKPMEVKNLLLEGNQRFLAGQRMLRDFNRQIDSTSEGQYPLAVMLSCIDSRTPAELVFDLGLGDIFSIRIAGNVAKEKVLGSMEYGCQVAGAKLVVVMGHTRCGAVGSSVDLFLKKLDPSATGCEHLGPLVQEIQKSLSEQDRRHIDESPEQLQKFIDHIAMLNMRRTVQYVRTESHSLARMEQEGKIALCGAMYDVSTGAVIFDT